MESKNLIIASIWGFMLFACIAMIWVGQPLSFVGYLLFFFIALMSTVAVASLLPKKEGLRNVY